MKEETKKFCPKCALENIKTKLHRLPDDILSCSIGHWIGKEVGGKLVETLNCPRCALENIKTGLKNYPNHFLTCSRCQWVGKQVSGSLIESVL